MPPIFLSHSSADEREAVALKQWLADKGWNDVFLDVDPQRGLAAGERWEEALRHAADRCEAVVFIVSPAWAKSKWCLAEFLLAKSLHKLIFGVVMKEVPIGELPTEMTAEWQLCRLTGNGSTETIRFPYRETTDEIAFLAEGLLRLREGLRKAGLTAEFFRWPPKDDPRRAPYRGLEPLEASDAAVFFGRDVEILRGLDALRGMRESLDKKLFVILGASGAGKSSFLRAGLLPRLARDDRHFFALAPIRPEREPLFGERGLAHALHHARAGLRLPSANLGDIKARLRQGPAGLAGLIRQLQDALCARLLGLPEGASPPTLVLPVDQAEELFNADAAEEARSFLQTIGGVLRAASADTASDIEQVPMIVAFTIRSDRYEPLQTASELAGLQSVVFDDLKPMPPTRFREVIVGPARRASAEGARLVVAPELVERLVGECAEGGDALPLLGLTLARLYRDFGGDGDLRLDEYQAMGGLANIVKTEAESVLARDAATRQQQLELLHAAFVPWLATINPQNDQPMRRLTRRADLPGESHALLDALVEKRLLLTDRRDGVAVIEVAHEALLRQWDVLADWLISEREGLKDADVLERAVQAWEKSGRKDAWLMEGERLTIAEALATKPGFRKRLEGCREFLLASRQRDDARREEDERRRQAELEAAQQLAAEQGRRAEVEALARRDAEASVTALRAWRRRLIGALAGVAVVAVAAVGMFVMARQSEQRAKESSIRANVLRLVAEAQAMFSGARGEGDEQAMLQLLAGARIAGGAVDGDLLAAVVKMGDLRKLVKTDADVNWVAFSPDGSRIVSAGDKTLRLWDAKTGQPVGGPLVGHEGAVESVAFSRDGQRIVSGGTDHTLRLWDAQSGQPIGAPLEGHEFFVSSVAFSPDGRRIVSSSSDKTLRLWDAESGQPIGTPLEGHQGDVLSVAFSPGGSRIVSGGDDKTLRLWDARSGQPIGAPLEGHEFWVSSVAFSPDGRRIVSGSDDKTLRLWDAQSGQPIGAPLKGHQSGVASVAFSPDGRRIVSGSRDETLRLWDAWSGQPIGAPLAGHKREVSSVAFSADGRRILSGSGDQTLRLWDANSSQSIGAPLEGHSSGVLSVAFSPDGRRIVSGSLLGTLSLWDAHSGQPIGAPLAGHKGWVSSVAFSYDGHRIVSGSGDNTLRLWDVQSGQPIGAPLEGHTDKVSSVAFSSDGSRIVSGSFDRTLRLWDARSGQPIGAPLEGHKGGVWSVAFSPDGRRIVSTSSDKTLRLWDADNGQPIGAPLEGHKDNVLSVAFSPDGRRIVSGSGDNTLRLWDAQGGQPIGVPFAGHKKEVSSVAFSPDGRRIASGSADRTLRLWDAYSGQPIGPPLEGHGKELKSVAFSPDGRRIVSGSYDNTLRLWPAPAAWPDELCAKLTRNMSRKQWREWVSPDIAYKCQCPGLPIPLGDPNSKAAPELCPGKPAESMIPLDRPPT